MKPQELKERLRGAVVTLITPFRADFELDLDGLRENTRFIIDSGVRTGKGVLLAGGACGEFPCLTIEERKKVAKAVGPPS